jgi:dTDP-4-amino-4,6-dideoxygalactose transaminase
MVERRDELLACCNARQIECKVHYPVPLYCQPGLRHLGYQPGSFPATDHHAASAITIPVHQYLEPRQLEFASETVRLFYKG